jgi:putative tryptophan/tyrosine transport system substrate-binding protein
MRRREFITGVGALAAVPLRPASLLAQTRAPRRVGYVFAGSVGANISLEGLKQGWAELGYRVGSDLIVDERYAEGQTARLPTLIKEVLALNPEVLVTSGTVATTLARAASDTTPIVCLVSDPVLVGLVQSLAHPGGNVTGLSVVTPDFAAKWLDILKTAIPTLHRVAFLWAPGNYGNAMEARALDATAPRFGVTLSRLSILAEDVVASLPVLIAANFDAFIVAYSSLTEARIPELIALAARNRLPALYAVSTAVRQGGLMSYSADYFELWRRAASYADRILKGAHPGDLPIEQATSIKFAINLATAKALGLEIPSTLLAAADELIE